MVCVPRSFCLWMDPPSHRPRAGVRWARRTAVWSGSLLGAWR